MIISVDINNIEYVSILAQRASELIAESSKLLNSLISHDDWSCKERYLINDGISALKSKQSALVEVVEKFSSDMNKVAKIFEDTESQIYSILGDNDAELSSLYSITPISTEFSDKQFSNYDNVISKNLSGLKAHNTFEGFAISNFNQSIKVCEFNSVNFSQESIDETLDSLNKIFNN